MRTRAPAVRLDEEIVILAESDEKIVAIVRLCTEEGNLVLRGMYVEEEFRRRGIGKRLLYALKNHLRGRDCFCLAYSYLVDFYAAIGFIPIRVDRAPAHLQERLRTYLAIGLDVITLCCPGLPEEATVESTVS